MVQELIGNLIRNALGDGRNDAARVHDIGRLADHDIIGISVGHTGPSPPETIRDRLLKPFMSTKGEGMGLGLSICRSIVEAHGRKFRSEPNFDGGTVFRLTLTALSKQGMDNAG